MASRAFCGYQLFRGGHVSIPLDHLLIHLRARIAGLGLHSGWRFTAAAGSWIETPHYAWPVDPAVADVTILDVTERDRALETAMKLLRMRDRFIDEIAAKLRDEGFPQEDVEYVVEHLRKKGILNDDNTTQRHIARNSGKRAVGIEKLRSELEKLGAPEETIEANLDGMAESEPERALEALRLKYGKGADRAKAGRFLYARGFQEEAIESALDRFCAPADFPE